MKKLALVILCLVLATPALSLAQRRSSSGSHSSKSSKTSSHKTKSSKSASPRVSNKRTSKAKCATCPRDSHGKIKRSASATSAFKSARPCPATGRTSGPCRGYVIDHMRPLASGGADDPSNMQWQTKAEAKAKDKWERKR